MICLTPKPSQSFFVYRIQSEEKNWQKKSFLRKRWSGGLNKKWKESFLIATAIKKDPTKHTNELKVIEKTVRTAIKQDLRLDLNPPWLHYVGCFRKQNMLLPTQIFVHLR